MSFLVRDGAMSSRGDVEDVLAEVRGRRTGSRGQTGSIPRSQALRLSASWACLRLRADLMSTMPTDVFRRIQGVQVEQAKPPVLVNPDGSDEFGWEDWMYRTTFDLDSTGNTIGVIEEIDGAGRPALIRLLPAADVGLRRTKGKLFYGHRGQWWPANEIWHERQFPVSGTPLGLSPIAHAALSMQPGISAAQFAATWFGNSATPAQHLRNKSRKLNKIEARKVKQSYLNEVSDGDVWVSGSDWELNLLSAKASESMFLEQIQASTGDICRFLGVPGDMIDAESSTGSITYANVTQRNLQLLIMNINPALIRRESRFSAKLLPAPRYVKFNRGALLQMDLAGRFAAYKIAVDGRWMTPDHVRDLENEPPLTPEDEAQFNRLFGNKAAQPPTAPVPVGGTP